MVPGSPLRVLLSDEPRGSGTLGQFLANGAQNACRTASFPGNRWHWPCHSIWRSREGKGRRGYWGGLGRGPAACCTPGVELGDKGRGVLTSPCGFPWLGRSLTCQRAAPTGCQHQGYGGKRVGDVVALASHWLLRLQGEF